jgi:hypothetical protein
MQRTYKYDKIMFRKFILVLTTLLASFPILAQEEWENAATSNLKWKTDARLVNLSDALSNLKVSNLTSESASDKASNKWSSLDAYLNQTISLDRPCEITFNVTNTNCYLYKQPERVAYTKKKVKGGRVVANIAQSIFLFPWGIGSWWWNPARETHTYVYKDTNRYQVYWGYTLSVTTSNGQKETYNRNFCDGLNSSTDYMYSDNSNWRTYYSGKDHAIKLVYGDDNSLKIYDNSDLVKTYYNVKYITYLGLRLGVDAKLEASSFSFRQKSNYGIAKPRIDEGMCKMQKEDWYNAARDFTYVIETLHYSNFDVLFARGFAYAMQEHYKTAIEDLSNALGQYGISSENKESAYYLRGLCRANIGDEECVNDMRKAGQDGKIWLRENNLENYVVGSSSINTQSKSKSSSVHRFLPEKFRK